MMVMELNFLQNEAIRFGIWLILYCLVSSYVFMTVYRTQPTPFIDEIFHIRQAKFYCDAQFNQWDDKITTLPGLYLFTVGIYGPLSIFGIVTECSVFLLRGMNLIISIANFYIIYSILQSLDTVKRTKRRFHVWDAFNISIFPVTYFFNFFYYTDTLSTFSVLLMFRLHLAENFIIASFIGLLSVLIRQTNIVWVGFFLYDALHQCYLKSLQKTNYPKNRTSSFLGELLLAAKILLTQTGLFNLLSYITGYASLCILFLAFVFWNEGVVVGDRTAHQPTIHFCQLFYFALFVAVFSVPSLLPIIRRFARFCTVNFYKILMVASLMSFVIYYNTMAHPYLLADNRHYVFYVWKNLYQKNILMRYLLIPLYIFSFYAMSTFLEKTSWRYIYWLSVCLLLVPHKLLEFRYFILPFIMLRISMEARNRWQLALESILFSTINVITIYIFVTKKFYWSDSNEVQRIIW